VIAREPCSCFVRGWEGKGSESPVPFMLRVFLCESGRGGNGMGKDGNGRGGEWYGGGVVLVEGRDELAGVNYFIRAFFLGFW
jgi:hypothetical protein